MRLIRQRLDASLTVYFVVTSRISTFLDTIATVDSVAVTVFTLDVVCKVLLFDASAHRSFSTPMTLIEQSERRGVIRAWRFLLSVATQGVNLDASTRAISFLRRKFAGARSWPGLVEVYRAVVSTNNILPTIAGSVATRCSSSMNNAVELLTRTVLHDIILKEIRAYRLDTAEFRNRPATSTMRLSAACSERNELVRFLEHGRA